MEYKQRVSPLFSACGLNCGLCPRYHTDGNSKCPGCAGAGFLEKHPRCGVLSSSQRHGIEYCYLCDEYPCKKYDGADLYDSFITHKNQFTDLDKAKTIGVDSYLAEQNSKVEILNDLLKSYDDGRRKSFFCLAVNLLKLQDCKYVMMQIQNEINVIDISPKEKTAIAVNLFKSMAQTRDVELKLRKKSKL